MEPVEILETITQDVRSVQENVLEEILSANGRTEYLAGFNLDGATDTRTFKSKVPVVRYEDIQHFIQRIANGDRSPILCSQPIKEFYTSSGTSGGERKLIPTVDGGLSQRQLLVFGIYQAIMNKSVAAGSEDGGKGLYFNMTKAETKTPGGLVARTALTSLFKSDRFEATINNRNTSPVEAILCPDTFQSMYAQMLSGLYQRHQVSRMGAAFASAFLRAIRFLQLHWQQLADDIRTGLLTPEVTDVSVRECMTKWIMKPDPRLADFITKECSAENWGGILGRIWPKTVYLETVITGAMAQYVSALDYYGGGIPIVSATYASSECWFGINLNPFCDPSHVSYTFMPNLAYFEFLPIELQNGYNTTSTTSLTKQEQLVDLADVEIGKEYEVVVTTYSGLYRYRVGDILRVTGFHNSAPQFRFLMREGVILSIDVDKTNEMELQVAIGTASELLADEFGIGICDYTSSSCTETIPGHYVIYWELLEKESSSWPTDEAMEKCCLEMENSLNPVYRRGRVVDKSIGPLEVRIVRKGTFEEVMDRAIARGASITQYKTPRCMNNSNEMVEFLDSRVVSTHFSTSLPQWTPKPQD